jgi:two-component system, chemotaxis family, protein-glutamate methylesterase/glutaminase
MRSSARDIIVIGASAGGVEALRRVVSALPSDIPAAIFIVMHIPAWHDSALPAILSRCSSIPAVHPKSGDPVEHGRIYVAPPDQHLIIDSANQVQLWHGPKENGFRPSINALFRSAAVTFGARVTGVVLTGGLDDGAAGLWWIKRMGGAVVVQDPSDADFPDMPQNALLHVPADHVAKLTEIAPILDELARPLPRARTEQIEGWAT